MVDLASAVKGMLKVIRLAFAGILGGAMSGFIVGMLLVIILDAGLGIVKVPPGEEGLQFFARVTIPVFSVLGVGFALWLGFFSDD